jgi:hypothetical protein
VKATLLLLTCLALMSRVGFSREAGQTSANPPAPKLRVLVTESDAWLADTGPPQTDDIVRALISRCQEMTVTVDYKQESDYIVRLDKKGAQLKFAVLSKEGGAVYTGTKATPADAPKTICSAIQRAVIEAKKKPEPPREPNLSDKWPGAGKPKKP